MNRPIATLTKRPQHFHSELHLHMYGCITAPTLWELGKDRWQKQKDRLDWYSAEYLKAYGRQPDYASYWQRDNGFELLQRDFEFTEPAPFAGFQARFNLLIALLPITPDDPTIIEHVLNDLRATGLRYAEVRGVFPMAFTASDAGRYLDTITKTAAKIEADSGGSFVPRLAMSLPRRDDLLASQYQWLRDFMMSRPEQARYLSAIDFSHYEEGYPPRDKAGFFKQLKADNQNPARGGRLALLYHVGESFSAMSIMSAARWVYEAQQLGSDRLGHAIALGLEPENLRGRQIKEPVKERRDHLQWLRDHETILAMHGYKIAHRDIQQELTRLEAMTDEHVTVTYDDAVMADARSLQEALMAILREQGAIIESCPTSNFRIGQIASAAMHPLPRFLKAGLNVVVSTDDPGIFAISLASEEQVCRETLGISETALAKMATLSEKARSEHLTAGK